MNNQHPLTGFNLRASIDRIVIEVRLNQPTQFQHVQARMASAGAGKQYVHEIDPQTFRTTIQNPTGPDAFMVAVQALAPPGSGPVSESDVRILEVEISLDAKPRAPADRDQLVNATLHLVHHHANPPGKFRIVRSSEHWQGTTAPPSQMLFKVALQAGDNTICAGWHADVVKRETWGDPFRLRAYVKEYDTNPKATDPKATYKSLAQEKQAARIEAILSGDRRPFTTVAEWRAFKFESLTKYFRQVRPTPASQLAALSQRWLVALGQPTDIDKKASHRRNSMTGTARDTDLNRRIYVALTRLTQRQK